MKAIKKLANIKLTVILINALLFIVFFHFLSSSQILIDINTFMNVVGKPFIIGFLIAYVLYPLITYFKDKGIHLYLSITLIYIIIAIILFLIISLLIPILINQSTLFIQSLSNNINHLYPILSERFNMNDFNLIQTITYQIEGFIFNFGSYFIDSIFTLLSIIGNGIMSIIFSIYFILSFDTYHQSFSIYINQKNTWLYHKISFIHHKITDYFLSMILLMIVKMIEYAFVFIIVRQPNWLVLAIFTGIMIWLPYIGPIFANVVMIVAGFGLSPFNFTLLIILIFILSNIDQYYISPLFLSKVIKIHPLFIFLMMMSCSYFFGILGIFISIPLCIIIYGFYYQNKEG